MAAGDESTSCGRGPAGVLARRLCAGLAATMASATGALAGPTIVPALYAAIDAPRSHSILTEIQPYTEQIIYDNSLLSSSGIVPGTMLLGMAMRVDFIEYPEVPDNFFYQFRVRIGVAARDAAHAVGVFATNVQGGESGYTTMRDSALVMFSWTMPADTATHLSGPANPFGAIIGFDLPFVYTGAGEGIVLEISRTAGYHTFFLDAYPRGTVPGSMSFSNPGFGATEETGPYPSQMTTMLAFDVPEPASLALVALGMAGLLASRRRR
jgi:hypothetical protein